MAMLMFTVIIIVYYIVFASLGVNVGPYQEKEKKALGLAFIEVILWSVFILLVNA